MYENDYMSEQLIRLENENLALRKQAGEFGFFGGTYGTPRTIEIRNRLEKELTVYQWGLISNLNINYTPEQITECANLLLKLVGEGIFDPTPFMNPYSYGIYNGPFYPPMGTGVIADPAVTNAFKPDTLNNKITISGLVDMRPMYVGEAIQYNNDAIIIDLDKHPNASEIIRVLKLKMMETIDIGRVITIIIPETYMEYANEVLNGHKDFELNNVRIYSRMIMINEKILYPLPIINCILTIFAKIFGKSISEINNDYADLIGSTEEGDISNNESD